MFNSKPRTAAELIKNTNTNSSTQFGVNIVHLCSFMIVANSREVYLN